MGHLVIILERASSVDKGPRSMDFVGCWDPFNFSIFIALFLSQWPSAKHLKCKAPVLVFGGIKGRDSCQPQQAEGGPEGTQQVTAATPGEHGLIPYH